MLTTPEPHMEHHAFVYGSVEEFVAAMAPFAREGVESGDQVFAATTAANVEALREELGDLAARVELRDTTAWNPRPYERLQAFRAMLAELPAGRSLRAMSEPVWEGSAAVKRQWARGESIANLVLAKEPMRLVCLYDAALPDSILDFATRTHPAQIDGSGPVPSHGFADPSSFAPGPAPEPRAGAIELPLEGAAFRGLLAHHGREAGLSRERVEDLVLAANEVVSNAIRHGRDPIVARAWVADEEFVCRVSDAGSGIDDPLVGWMPPAKPAQGGWGLPIARQLCDALEISPPGSGATTVSLHFSL